MQTILSKRNIILAAFFVVVGGQSVYADGKKMYRWIDDSGKVFYSDQIAPKHIKYKRESLNQNARVVKTIEKEKTKDQRDLEKRLKRLQKQQEAIINKQKSHDKVLLSTYRNINDMSLALKGQMLALDSKRKVIRGNLNRLEQQLLDKQKKAAQYERDGYRVPTNLLTDIAASKQKVEGAYIEISNQFKKKKKTREMFEEDITRFSFLIATKEKVTTSRYETVKNKAAKELGLFICESINQCNRAWVSAKEFVHTHSTVALDIETDSLIMSRTPYKDTDLSLSASKMMADDGNQQLFLDIRCRKSSLGEALCRGEKVKKIRQSFSSFIKSTLPKESDNL